MKEVFEKNLDPITYKTPLLDIKRAKIIDRMTHAKSFKVWLQTSIGLLRKDGNIQDAFVLEGILKKYNEFNPKLRATVHLDPFKGDSGIKIQPYPNYIKATRWQKTDKGVKEIVTLIERDLLQLVINSFRGVEIGENVPTWKIAREYCLLAGSVKDSKGRSFFSGDEFDFQLFSGNRGIYLKFWITLRILDHYGMIEYFKEGSITKLKDSVEIPCEFE